VREKRLLGTQHLHGARWKPGQTVPSARRNAQFRCKQRTNQAAQALEMLFDKRTQRRFQPVETPLNLNDGDREVPKAAPLRSGRDVKRGGKTKPARTSAEVLGCCKRTRQRHSVLIKVQIRKKEAKPFDETRALQVGSEPYFLHGPLKVLNAPVEVARSIRHTSLGQQQGCCVENSEEFFAWSWQMVSRQRGGRHGIFEPFSKAFRLRREPPRTHSIKALSSRSNPTASVPYEEIDLHAVLGHNGGRMPLHHKPHTAT
jgi:hypothetical protein